MSMDLSVWCSNDVKLPSQLPSSTEWHNYDNEWAYEGDGWQVLAMEGNENPTKEIKTKFPKASKIIYVTLEPIGADKVGYDLLEKVVRTLAKSCGGVWVDPNGKAYFHNEGSFQ